MLARRLFAARLEQTSFTNNVIFIKMYESRKRLTSLHARGVYVNISLKQRSEMKYHPLLYHPLLN